ncbi:MAG: YlxM family DNA-binding protein [Actinobacteria bacterium]|nr:YlxM family DNA-binding protein [Actinomycetota bacterium]
MIEKLLHISLLFDFYGQLLTVRQRELVELYFQNDLSLGELAGEFGVSRQAIHDILKRAREMLEEYEAKLGLVQRHLDQQVKLREIDRLLAENQVERARCLVAELLRE